MKKILGLDLGTTSIGWAVVNEAENQNEQSEIIKLGVRVIPMSSDERDNFATGKAITTNQDRTSKRGARRGLQRYKDRRKKLTQTLMNAGWIDKDFQRAESGSFSTFNNLSLRAKAPSEPCTLEELAKVFFSINKKRGYKSNRKANQTDEETGTAIDGMDVALLLIRENITPGQYLFRNALEGQLKAPEFYKSDLEREFIKIWRFQATFYPEILTEDFLKVTIGKGKKKTTEMFYARHKLDSAEIKGKEKTLVAAQWRADALTTQLPIDQVIYALAEINGGIAGSSGYLAEISDRSKELHIKKQTVGQYIYNQVVQNPHTKLRGHAFYRKDYENEFETIWAFQKTVHPEHLTDDLKSAIKNTIIFHQRPLKSQKGKISVCELEGVEKKLTIKGKQKIKKIGPKVSPKSAPLFQEFRILQVLNNVEIREIATRTKWSLQPEQRQLLFDALQWRDKLSSAEALALLFGKKEAVNYELNFKELEGNRTQATLLTAYKKILTASGYDVAFQKMESQEIEETLATLFTELGIETGIIKLDGNQPDNTLEQQAHFKLWHLLYAFEGDDSVSGDEKLRAQLREKFGFDAQAAKIMAQVIFQDDHASVSTKAIKKILPHLRNGLKYSDAAAAAGYNHSSSLTAAQRDSRTLEDRVRLIEKNSLRNPVVEKILNQMAHVVNGVIDTYGKPDEVRIELARELKMSMEERERMTKSINQSKKNHDEITAILKRDFHLSYVSRNDIIKYKLYQELKNNGYKTLYSNQYVAPEKLFTNEIDVEHIIPKSVQFDDSFSNKTLEFRKINQEKGDQTAYDYILDKYGETGLKDYETRLRSLMEKGDEASKLSRAKFNKLMTPFDKVQDGFIDRDLRNSQYIAKKAKEVLEKTIRLVNTTTGAVTARLREDWQLIDVLKELNLQKYTEVGLVYQEENREGKKLTRIQDWTKRSDHRHHAMDALTVAFTRPEHVQYLNNMSARKNDRHKQAASIRGIEQKHLYKDKRDGKWKFHPPMPLDELRTAAKNHLEAILVSFKAKNKVVTPNTNRIKTKTKGVIEKTEWTPRGQLHNETVYGTARRPVTRIVKVDGKMTAEVIKLVADEQYRAALQARLERFDNDPKRAFTGVNSLAKAPLWLDRYHTQFVPEKVKLVELETIFTIKKQVSPDLKLDKVVDAGIKKILQDRLAAHGGNAKAAFSNLDENPIWQNEKAGIAIKSVRITGVTNAVALHTAKDHFGQPLLDENGQAIPSDYVSTSNNHHVAIFKDEKGVLQEQVVSFYEAVMRENQGLPVVDTTFNQALGWTFLFTLKQNEYFVFPNPKTGFDPNEMDLLDPANFTAISPNLFRVQNISTGDYIFSNHLITIAIGAEELKNKNLIGRNYYRIRSPKNLEGIIKIRINHLGQITAICHD